MEFKDQGLGVEIEWGKIPYFIA